MTVPPVLSEFYARLTAAPPARRARRTLLVFCWQLTLLACIFLFSFALMHRHGEAAIVVSLMTLFEWRDYFGARKGKEVSQVLLTRWWTEWPFGAVMTWIVWDGGRYFARPSHSGASFSGSRAMLLLAIGVLVLVALGFLTSLIWWWVQVIAELGWPVKPKAEIVFSTEGVWPPAPKRPDETTND